MDTYSLMMAEYSKDHGPVVSGSSRLLSQDADYQPGASGTSGNFDSALPSGLPSG